MLAILFEIMPLFIVRIVARKYCGTLTQGGAKLHHARPGVFVAAKSRKGE